MEKVNSYSDFLEKSLKKEKTFLLLYKPEGEQSSCAYNNLLDAWKKESEAFVYTADVSQVRDIHEKFGINSVPSLLIFSNGQFENTVKGCHDSIYFRSIMENAIYQAKEKAEGKTAKNVVVYSTPSCSWCNTLKTWLRKNNIRFTDIDISRDQKAAEEMVRKSGQKGVPQTDVNGQRVVGFNQARLKELLEIQ